MSQTPTFADFRGPYFIPDDIPMPGAAEITRWADSPMHRLVRGQRVTLTFGDVPYAYRVTDVSRDERNGHETYQLAPAELVSGMDPADA